MTNHLPPPMPIQRRTVWVGLLLVAIGLAWSCVSGCHSREIAGHIGTAIVELQESEKQLVADTMAHIEQLVAVRDETVEKIGAAAYRAAQNGDGELAEYLQEVAHDLSERLTEAGVHLVQRLRDARKPVIDKILAELKEAHRLAMDDAALFALLMAPAGVLGWKLPGAGGGGSGGGWLSPPRNTSWGSIAAISAGSILTSLLMVEGGKKAVAKTGAWMARRSAKKVAQIADAVSGAIPTGEPDRPKVDSPPAGGQSARTTPVTAGVSDDDLQIAIDAEKRSSGSHRRPQPWVRSMAQHPQRRRADPVYRSAN